MKKQLFFLCILLLTQAQGQNSSLQSNELVFGMSGSLKGHFGFYGNAIKHGIEAYFNRVNDTHGIQGKKLTLVALNDNGDAQETKKNIETLIAKGVTCFIGIMGTRGILSILPLLQENKIALFFPWATHPSLQNSALTTIINGPGLLDTQLVALNNYITKNLALNNIAIFHADDEFSSDGAQFLQKLLKNDKINVVDVQGYNRFTVDIYTPTNLLIKKSPRLVVSIATGIPTVTMIKQFFTAGLFDTHFLGTEGTFLAKNILKHQNIPFSFSSAVPDPLTSTMKIAQQYKEDMTRYFPDDELTVLSFMYYISAAIIGQALNTLQQAPTATNIVKAIENLKKTHIGDFPIDFDPANRFMYGKQVWIV